MHRKHKENFLRSDGWGGLAIKAKFQFGRFQAPKGDEWPLVSKKHSQVYLPYADKGRGAIRMTWRAENTGKI